MAELAIPLALLGGMYIMSNQDKKEESKPTNQTESSKTEGFVNNRTLSKHIQNTVLDNPQNTNVNYPLDTRDGNVYNHQEYIGTTSNAKYHTPEGIKEYQNSNSKQGTYFQSLTGEVQNSNNMVHNNMTPFFGSKVKQQTGLDGERQMDYMTGAGSTFIHKKEQAPLFAPESGMDYANGAPSNVDFMHDRMSGNISMKRNNDKPWEEVRVGPGLGKGAGTEGSGGFNSGMEARDLWRDRTVDELRVKTNPKLTYGGVILGPKAQNTERGNIGQVEKRLPDRFYENGPERYFTTTGVEKGPTVRSQQVSDVMNTENRETTSTSYYGVRESTDGKGTYVEQNFRDPHRQELESTIKHTSNMKLIGGKVADNEYGVNGYKESQIPNNRSVDSKKQQEYGGVSTAVKAMFSPLMDMLRPSRKQNVVGNARIAGNANGVFGNKSGYILNPADRPKTTIKEMNVHRKDHMFLGNQQTDNTGYMNANPVIYGQQRDTTQYSDMGRVGDRAAATGQTMLYNSAYNANLIDKAPISKGRAPMGGGPRVLNSNLNITKQRDENVLCNKSFNAPAAKNAMPPSREIYGKVDRRSEFGQDIHAQRMNTMDFTAFNSNPFTHSLTNVVNY
jgi:hypothetical protein